MKLKVLNLSWDPEVHGFDPAPLEAFCQGHEVVSLRLRCRLRCQGVPSKVSGSSRGGLRRSQDEGRLRLFFALFEFSSGC